MYSRDSKSHKGVIRMDPNCAICHAPAMMACDCEAKGLEMAVRQAEDRMMRSSTPIYDYVLEYFRLLAERRKNAHTTHLDQISAHAFYHYNAPPHPNQIADAQATLKRGIDEDWQASIQRYPEVLEYYFGLVELTLPADDEPAVKDPPLSALNGHRKATRRGGTGGGADAAGSSTNSGGPFSAVGPPPPSFGDRNMPLDHNRRTPVRRERRSLSSRLPPASSSYAPYT